MKRVVVYTNQFFGQIGGEDKAYIKPILKLGAVGSANLFNSKLQDAEVIATLICGDNYYAENMKNASTTLLEWLKDLNADILIAGPAFNAGRFGMACGDLCASVENQLKIHTLTGLFEENPAVEIYKDKTYIIRTGKNAAGMRDAVSKMSKLANKLLIDQKLGLPTEENYIAKGIRVNIFKDKTGAERALDMLVKKINGQPFKSEIPIPTYETIVPADPVKNLCKAKIALITTGGIVPKGNPDHLPAATAKFYCKYDISKLNVLAKGNFESVHAGYDPVYANDDPNRVVPLDVLRILEEKQIIGSLYNFLYVTTGNSTSVANATSMGQKIAQELLQENIDAVILTST